MNEDEAIEIIKRYYFNKEKINPLDVSSACSTLYNIYRTGKQAASKVGTSESFINFWKRIDELPDDIKGYILRGDLKPSIAEVLHRIKHIEDKRELAWAIIDNKLTREEVIKFINYIMKNKKSVKEGLIERYGERKVGMHAIVIGIDDKLYRELRVIAGKSGTFEKEICERIVRYWIEVSKEMGEINIDDLFNKIKLYYAIVKKASDL
jgi:hypothetical protein